MKIALLTCCCLFITINDNLFAGQRHKERRQQRLQARCAAGTCAPTSAPAYANVNQYPNQVTPLGAASSGWVCDSRGCRPVQRSAAERVETAPVPTSIAPNIIGNGTFAQFDASKETEDQYWTRVNDANEKNGFPNLEKKYGIDAKTANRLGTSQYAASIDNTLAQVAKKHMTCDCGCDKCTCPKPATTEQGVIAPPVPESPKEKEAKSETDSQQEEYSSLAMRSSVAPRIGQFSIVR